MITHYDLFAGIGGFSLALDEVFHGETIKHIFCEWEAFPAAVLKKHWPDGEFWGDIAELVAHTGGKRPQGQNGREPRGFTRTGEHLTVLTGGFPCQPFSTAGRRRGTSDDRYKWPEMFAVIQNVAPDWVIAENVRGLVDWNDSMVLEQVCTDLEAESYEVWPLIIPAVAVNAPHRRDRVWVIAHSPDKRPESEVGLERQSQQKASQPCHEDPAAANSGPQRRQPGSGESLRPESQGAVKQNRNYPDWQRDWQEIAFATCHDAVDDGLPRLVDGVRYSRAKWRRESIKAYGNAIVPEVAMEIFRAIKETL